MVLTRSIGRGPSFVTGAPSSSSSTLRLKHDVFLSFYGKETRYTFADHLFAALKGNSIKVFRDKEGIKRGTFIDSELRKAIKKSKIAIVVLSESYAFSRWCLNELAQIIACIKETGIKVLPVFYHVDPSNVKKQNGTFALAFAKHKKDSRVTSEKIQTWKNALKCVGGIAGFVLQDNIYESTVIQCICGVVRHALCGGASLEATLEEVLQVLHDRVNNVGGKVLMVESFIKKLDCPEQGTLSSKRGWLSCPVPRPPDFTVGLDVPLKVLKTQLLKEEKQQILLTAPGGCGKTALMKRLGHDQEIKGKFKGNIFFVPVSKSLNLMVIVQRLFHHIWDRKPELFHHKCDWEPEFQSDEDAINQLEVLLTHIGSSPILLILDDVWPGSEFRLEKFKFDIPKFNILVTSRSTLPEFSFTYNLKPLNDEDAMTLLRHSASLQDGSSHIPDDVIKKIVRGCGGFPLALEVNGKSLYKKIVRGCGGFPLALKVIGGLLRKNPVEAWCSIAENWSNSHYIFNSNSDLLDCLRKSLEFSDHEVIFKECFMDLGSFPEDQRIPVAALIDMWAELHKLDEVGNNAIHNLHNIATRNLANLVRKRKDASGINKYYNEDYVTQHDLLRELAIFESCQGPERQRQRLIMDISGNTLPSWCTEQDQQPINARLLSISTDESFLSTWFNIQAPKVEVLVLNFQTKNYSLPEFVDKMDNLKVLIITNYGFFPTELRNFQLLKSLPNLKTIRLEKVSIPSLCKAPVLLKSLKKISLFMCKIGQAFQNFTIQVSDALPNLMEINIDYCNDLVELPAVLCDVICLKKLSITNCHQLSALPNGIGKLVNLEVLRLGSCTDLSELPESIRSFHKLCILDISDCLGIRHFPKDIGELCNLKELHMKGCLSLRKGLPPSTSNLEQLKLVICDEERAKFWEPIKEVLTNLKVKVAEKDINLTWLLKP
ncbi:probable disease resistance protein At5g66900 isoform X2 [Quercus robur]|uniref:probable disease resistance protein At5g66900 isoform X2 n=1 Tax=Quercus robur TaxID=38942 RepID=UPI0021620CA7|nr:probable disease resistance protein At5g66900 isoform X2 [Quercus robur]